MKRSPYFLSATIGNLFEHYDKYLFSFLAPFLAPLFFKQSSPILSLLLTFGIMPLGLISRPLGALIFGKMGDQFGRKKVLIWTLFGMSIVTCLMGFLPTFETAGWIAPLLLALGRILQNFFAAGEVTGGALLLLENSVPKRRSYLSGLYGSSSILGILLASLAVAILSQLGLVETHWRYLYFAGALTAFAGMAMRLSIHENFQAPPKTEQLSTPKLLWKERRLFLTLCLVVGFSYALYENAATLLNAYIPIVTTLPQAQSSLHSSWILLIDLTLIPLFGYLAMRLSYQKTMLFFSLLTLILAVPLFQLLSIATQTGIICIRIVFVILGVGFSAPLLAWAQESTPRYCRFRLMSISKAIASQLIGGCTCMASLWMYQKTHWIAAPGLYLSTAAMIALIAQLSSRSLSIPNFSMRLSMGVKRGEGS